MTPLNYWAGEGILWPERRRGGSGSDEEADILREVAPLIDEKLPKHLGFALRIFHKDDLATGMNISNVGESQLKDVAYFFNQEVSHGQMTLKDDWDGHQTLHIWKVPTGTVR